VGGYSVLTLILRGAAGSTFGSINLRTPSFNSVSTLDVLDLRHPRLLQGEGLVELVMSMLAGIEEACLSQAQRLLLHGKEREGGVSRQKSFSDANRVVWQLTF
jgi:hypothetical protein